MEMELSIEMNQEPLVKNGQARMDGWRNIILLAIRSLQVLLFVINRSTLQARTSFPLSPMTRIGFVSRARVYDHWNITRKIWYGNCLRLLGLPSRHIMEL